LCTLNSVVLLMFC